MGEGGEERKKKWRKNEKKKEGGRSNRHGERRVNGKTDKEREK